LARIRPDFLAFSAGALLPLAFAPFDLSLLAILLPAILFAVWLRSAPRQAAWLGYLFGLGMFGTGVSWVYVAIHDFGYAGVPLAVFLTGLFVAFLALFTAGLGYLTARLFPVSDWSKLLLVFPAMWTLFEWFRGWFLTGFPWLNLGYSQISSPLRGFAPLLGVYGVSFVTAFSAGLLLIALRAERFPRAAYLAGLILLGVVGSFSATLNWTQPIDAPLRVSVIQGNIPQDTKWRPEAFSYTLDLYQRLTQENADSDLIIWPEAALPLFYHQASDYIAGLQQIARVRNMDLIIGLPVMDLQTRRYYNSMMTLGKEQRFYHKRHLVPFGDFVPLGNWLRGLIRFFDLPMSGFSAGPTEQPLLRVAGHRVGVTICYEDAFGEEVIRALPGADFLVNATNNAWYGNSLAPHQHLQISRMRALETGRYLLRATTNGISAIIGPRGELLAHSPQFATYVLRGQVQPMQGATPYVRFGNTPLLSLLVGILVLAWLRCRAGERVTAGANR
jgi:apolipoprotein N-acyltransferase